MKNSSGLLQASSRWAKKNLFDGFFMSLVSLCLITCLLYILYWTVEWAFINAVWYSENWETCKKTIATLHGAGARGACWGVFTGREGQFLFGVTYPKELYWRPTLALLLLPVALLPPIIASIPKKVIILSVIYPILAWVLISGGFGLQEVPSSHIGGFLLTIMVTIGATFFAVIAGFLLAIGQHYSILPLRLLCGALIEIFNGIPTLIWLFVGASVLYFFMPPGVTFDMMGRVFIFLGLPASAQIAYSLRTCLIHAEPDQWEAASSLGFRQSAAFWLIIVPQTFKLSIPKILHASAGLCRNTAILSIIGVFGPTGFLLSIQRDRAWSGAVLEVFVVTIFCYWLISFTISFLADQYSRRIHSQCSRPPETHSPSSS